METKASFQLYCAARAGRGEFGTEQVDVADSLELLVVGDAGGAIAEPDLGAQIDVDLRAAILRAAPVRMAEAPLVHQERPLDLAEHRLDLAPAGGQAARGGSNGKQIARAETLGSQADRRLENRFSGRRIWSVGTADRDTLGPWGVIWTIEGECDLAG